MPPRRLSRDGVARMRVGLRARVRWGITGRSYTLRVSLFRRGTDTRIPAEPPTPTLWRVDQYEGQPRIRVLATQLEDREPSPARRRVLLAEWVEFLSSEANIVELDLASRTPQELLDATSGQRGLQKLAVKWGPYRDLSALSGLRGLEDVALGGATGVESLEPLTSLLVLSRLYVSQAHKTGGAVLGKAVGLRELCLGNAHPGSDRNFDLPDLRWVRALVELRRLELPGTRIIDPDLTPILDLPHLEELRLPLRRSYRKQVFEFASHSEVFARVATNYEEYDAFVASTRGR